MDESGPLPMEPSPVPREPDDAPDPALPDVSANEEASGAPTEPTPAGHTDSVTTESEWATLPPPAGVEAPSAETTEPAESLSPIGPTANEEPVAEPATGTDEAEGAPEPAEVPAPVTPAPEALEGAPGPDETAPEAHEAPAAAPAQAERSEEAEQRDQAARENARRIGEEIETLRTKHVADGHWQFRAFFEHERGLHALFKELRPLHASDRNRLWSTFKQVGAEARRHQQEEWESRRYESIEARESVEEKIRRAEGLAQGEGSAQDFRRADSLLNEVRALLGSNAPDSPGQVLIGPDRRACWDRWRQVRDAVRQRRGGLQEQDYQTLAALVAETLEAARGGDAYQAVQRVKELQARLGKAYLRRGQFEELRRRLSEGWQAAQARIAEQRQERSQRRAEWRGRMEGHVARWRETLSQKQSQREHLQQQLVKLDGMEKNARSEDFAVQVRGWKDESADKLRRVEEFIADLEERIRSATRKLGGHAGAEAPHPEPPADAEGAPPADAGGTDSSS